MNIFIDKNKKESGKAAATKGASLIKNIMSKKQHINIILATGASQFDMLENLIDKDLDWSRIDIFHLDEYIGISDKHPASFRKYLKERVANKLPNLNNFHYVNGDVDDLDIELKRLNKLISEIDIDVAFIGIGENGHLAFNDPPADFETTIPYIIVTLDKKCREQQFNEGWFPTLDDVPKSAISMSIKQIIKSKNIICTVPDLRKAEAVAGSVNGEVSNLCPGSILQTHGSTYCFFDNKSASLIKK
ncbi:MAG: glucosamine-6-phosphate deaminase [Spirochaetaceae bacterium]